MFVNLIKHKLQAPEGDGGSGAGGGAGASGAAGGGNGQSGAGASGGASGSGAGGGLFDDGGGQGGAGGGSQVGGAAGGSGDGSGGNAGGGSSQAPVIPENWKDALPDELKQAGFMNKYKTPADLAKGYAHIEKMIGADKIVIPQRGSSPEIMRKEVYEKLGLPADPKEYKVALKDGTQVNEEFSKGFTEKAYEVGLLPDQASGVMQWIADTNKQAVEQATQAEMQRRGRELQGLQTEWGQAYEPNLQVAKAGMGEFLTPELQAAAKEKGLGQDPFFIKLMHTLGSTLSEDQIKKVEPTYQGGALSVADARRQIDEIKRDMKSPYYDKNHADHQLVKTKMSNLYKMAFPGAPNPTSGAKS